MGFEKLNSPTGAALRKVENEPGAAAQAQARMLLVYRKAEKDNLTAAEKKSLRKLNENW
jgi:hypothetical protein